MTESRYRASSHQQRGDFSGPSHSCSKRVRPMLLEGAKSVLRPGAVDAEEQQDFPEHRAISDENVKEQASTTEGDCELEKPIEPEQTSTSERVVDCPASSCCADSVESDDQTGLGERLDPVDEAWVYFDVHSENLEQTLSDYRIIVESALSVEPHLRLSLTINSSESDAPRLLREKIEMLQSETGRKLDHEIAATSLK